MRPALGTLLLLVAIPFAGAAQLDRVTGNIDSNETVVLMGSVHLRADPQYDQGPVESSTKLEYITMVTRPSAHQQTGLDRLLAEQQDPTSPNYRKWLTPEQYADRFGLSRADIDRLTSWLQSQGFAIVRVARGRDWIAFSGTAALVQNAFHSEIHYFNVHGERHFANATELAIPKALGGIVIGFHGLNDFRWKPMGIREPRPADFFPMNIRAFFNIGGQHFLAPDDIATIYNITPRYAAGIDGTGQKLVIVGQTDINLTDIQKFRSGFNLPTKDPQVINLQGHTISKNDVAEADLDLEWSGAVARNATIIYVNSSDVFTSASYAIDNKLAPVISMSYGGCEPDNKDAISGLELTMQKANTEGITFLASSGDAGAAACDSANSKSATRGLAVNYPASSPEVTGVGGTEFNEGSGTYWNLSNGPNGGSAISYIPEIAWNDASKDGTLAASGGGKSSCANSACTGFTKPSWQTGPGVPNDSVRDVPDVSLTASADHDGYILCSGGSCANGVANNTFIVGGTSASAPVFAGIVALLNQQLGTTPQGVGNTFNSTLYSLAQNPGNNIFHDITTGGNKVPCTKGSTGCPNGGTIGYSTTAGYDQATGLGSVDVNNLVCQWTGKTCTSTALTVVPSQVNPGTTTPVTLTANVTAGVGSGTPSGTVTFFNGTTQLGAPIPLVSGTATYSYDVSSLPAGIYLITAAYSGDSNFTASTSPVVDLIDGTTTTTNLGLSPSSVNVGSSGSVTLNATVSPNVGTGTPTGTMTFFNGSTQLGSPATLSNGGASLNYNPSSLTGGTYSITATYSGDSNFVTSTSAAQTLNVLDFTIAANPTTVSVSLPGQSGTTTLTTTGLGGFNQTLNYSCSGLPSGANCSFTSVSATNETLTITTAAASGRVENPFGRKLFYALLLPGLLGIVVLPAGTRQRALRGMRWLSIVAVLASSTIWLSACGGSGAPRNPGTPVGNSTVTVTGATSGANALSHTLQITLTVQ